MRQRWTAVLIMLWGMLAPLLSITLMPAVALAACGTDTTVKYTITLSNPRDDVVITAKWAAVTQQGNIPTDCPSDFTLTKQNATTYVLNAPISLTNSAGNALTNTNIFSFFVYSTSGNGDNQTNTLVTQLNSQKVTNNGSTTVNVPAAPAGGGGTTGTYSITGAIVYTDPENSLKRFFTSTGLVNLTDSSGKKQSAKPGGNGAFAFSGLAAGTYTLEAEEVVPSNANPSQAYTFRVTKTVTVPPSASLGEVMAANAGLEAGKTLTGADAQAADDNQVTDCDAGPGFTWLVCGIIRGMVKVVDLIRDKVVVPFLYQPPVDKNSDEYKPVYAIWSTVRDLAGVIFILLFVLLIFGTAIGYDNYTIKKALPHLIAGAILMPLSWYICVAVVDLGNVLGGGIVQFVNAALPHTTHIDLTSNMSKVFLFGAATAGTFALLGAVSGVGLGLVFTMVIAFAGVFFTLIFRKILLTILIVVSPLAMAAWVLPNTEKWTRKWWDNIIKVVMMYPIIMMLFMAGRLFSATASATTGNSTDFTVPLFQIAGLILPLFAVPWAFKLAGTGMALGQNAIGKLTKAADKRVGKDSDLAKTWRQNREMRNQIKKDEFAEKAAASGNIFGKSMYKARGFMAGSRNGSKTWFRGAAGQLAAEEARSKAYAAQGKLDAANLKKSGELKDEKGNPLPKETVAGRREAETAMAAEAMVQSAGKRQGVREAVAAAGGSAGGIGGYAVSAYHNAEASQRRTSNAMVGTGKAVRDGIPTRPTAREEQAVAYGGELESQRIAQEQTRTTLRTQAELDAQTRSQIGGVRSRNMYGIDVGARNTRIDKIAADKAHHTGDEIIDKDVSAGLHEANEQAEIAKYGSAATVSQRYNAAYDAKREGSFKAAAERNARIRTAGQVSDGEVREKVEREVRGARNKELGTITGTNAIARDREIDQLAKDMPGRASITRDEFEALPADEQERRLNVARDEMGAEERQAAFELGKTAENDRLSEAGGVIRGVAQGEDAIMIHNEANRLQALDPKKYADRKTAEAQATRLINARKAIRPDLDQRARATANQQYYSSKSANLQDAKAMQIAGEMGTAVGIRSTYEDAAGLAQLDAETQRLMSTDPRFNVAGEASRLRAANPAAYDLTAERNRLATANPSLTAAELDAQAAINVQRKAEQDARAKLEPLAKTAAATNLDPATLDKEVNRLLGTLNPAYNIRAEEARVRRANPAMTTAAVQAQALQNVRERAKQAAMSTLLKGVTTAAQGQQALVRSAATAAIEQGKRTQAASIGSSLALNSAAQSNTNLSAADLILTTQRNAEASQAAQEGAANARNREPRREYSEIVNLAMESEADKMRADRVSRAGNDTIDIIDESGKVMRTVPIAASGLNKEEMASLKAEAMRAFDNGNLDRMAAIMQKLTQSGGGRDAIREIAAAKLGRNEDQVVDPSNPEWVKYYNIAVSGVGDNAPDLKLAPSVAFDELSAEDWVKLDQRTMRDRMNFASNSDKMSKDPASRTQAVNEVIGVIEKSISDTRLRGRLKDVNIERMYEWIHEPELDSSGKIVKDSKGMNKYKDGELRPEVQAAIDDGRLDRRTVDIITQIHNSYRGKTSSEGSDD